MVAKQKQTLCVDRNFKRSHGTSKLLGYEAFAYILVLHFQFCGHFKANILLCIAIYRNGIH